MPACISAVHQINNARMQYWSIVQSTPAYRETYRFEFVQMFNFDRTIY